MEIKNNTPAYNNRSFGMAFIKPDNMDKLARYLTRSEKTRSVTDGLTLLVRNQSGNKHFNIEYIPKDNSFRVFPYSEEALGFYPDKQGEKIFPAAGHYSYSNMEKMILKMEENNIALQKSNASKFKKFMSKLGLKIEYALQYFNSYMVHPDSILPANLREASNYAVKMEKSVETRIRTREAINSIFNE